MTHEARELADTLTRINSDVECRFDAGHQPLPGSDMEAAMTRFHAAAARLRVVDPGNPALPHNPR